MIFLLARFSDFFNEEIIRKWIEKGGYFVLFGLLFSCGLGMPLPEDIPLIAAGAMVAAGKFNLAIACACAWCGIVGGDCVLYHIGKKFGDEVPKIPMIGRHVTAARMRQMHKMFERWGIWVVAVGRLFAGVRGAMVVVAGASKFNFWKFLIADGVAAIGSGGLFLYLGYYFGNKIPVLKQHVGQAKKYILFAALAAAVILGVMIWRKRRNLNEVEEDEANPTPAPEPTANVVQPGE